MTRRVAVTFDNLGEASEIAQGAWPPDRPAGWHPSVVRALPQDVVLIFCTVSGWREGRLIQVTDARKIYAGECFGGRYSAIQITTAGSLCAVLDLHTQGKLPTRGFLRQEEVRLDDFLANRFGACYACDTPDVPVKNGDGSRLGVQHGQIQSATDQSADAKDAAKRAQAKGKPKGKGNARH